ncbi:MAG: C25 family cysteine peptidase [Chloroflexi bacterium]|nr:C25 family cysteine peptidase [Chloroflexota bacterium]
MRLFHLGILAAVLAVTAGCGKAASPAPTPLAQNDDHGAALVYTSQAGVYRLDAEALRAAGLQAALDDPASLRLTWRGVEQPLWVQGEGKALTVSFYAAESESAYLRENVYWLGTGDGGSGTGDQGGGEREEGALEVSGLISAMEGRQGVCLGAAKAEENLLYQPQVSEGDHWMWQNLPAGKAQTIEISLPGAVSGPARLRLAAWGSTEAEIAPDHHLRATFNGAAAGEASWDGKGNHLIEADFNGEGLRVGVNNLTIEAPGDTGAAAEINFIDWVEIIYPRLPEAQDDRLECIGTGGALDLQGFSGPAMIVDISDPAKPELVSAAYETAAPFPAEAGRRYVFVGPQGMLQPQRLAAPQLTPDLRASGAGADYVAVGDPDLLAAVKPLLELRAGQGLKVVEAPLQAVYDQFNHGMAEPQAIQGLMQHAAANWQPAPGYLLLLGDASYDPRGYVAPAEANRLPTFLVNTEYGGETASDVGFVQINDDPWPDIAVGRIPARSSAQAALLVEKILDYEKSAASEGVATLTAIADGQEESFASDAQDFLDLFPEPYQATLFSPPAGVEGANLDIQTVLQQGDLLVAYFGHGSLTMWGKDKLFTVEDVGRLKSAARLPVVLNMTCLTGLFTHPKVDSMSEALLWQPDGGAVAALAPSSLTLPSDQSYLSASLAKGILAETPLTLGQIHLQARRQVPLDTPGAQDVMLTFMLFGDPALQLER